MIGEIWTFKATNPSNGKIKPRPILIIGTDGSNQLQYVDLHYVIISSSADCGIYDVKISEEIAKQIGLESASVIKTTKIYTDAKTNLGNKISNLLEQIKNEFTNKYSEYQNTIINNLKI